MGKVCGLTGTGGLECERGIDQRHPLETSIDLDDRWDRQGEGELAQSSLVFKAKLKPRDPMKKPPLGPAPTRGSPSSVSEPSDLAVLGQNLLLTLQDSLTTGVPDWPSTHSPTQALEPELFHWNPSTVFSVNLGKLLTISEVHISFLPQKLV